MGSSVYCERSHSINTAVSKLPYSSINVKISVAKNQYVKIQYNHFEISESVLETEYLGVYRLLCILTEHKPDSFMLYELTLMV